MKSEEQNRKYYIFESSAGFPAASDLFYECLKCGQIVLSLPADSTRCKCRNIMIDADYGRITMQEPEKVRLFKMLANRE